MLGPLCPSVFLQSRPPLSLRDRPTKRAFRECQFLADHSRRSDAFHRDGAAVSEPLRQSSRRRTDNDGDKGYERLPHDPSLVRAQDGHLCGSNAAPG